MFDACRSLETAPHIMGRSPVGLAPTSTSSHRRLLAKPAALVARVAAAVRVTTGVL